MDLETRVALVTELLISCKFKLPIIPQCILNKYIYVNYTNNHERMHDLKKKTG